MARLCKRDIYVENQLDRENKEHLEVEVQVSKKGEFYCILSSDQVNYLLDKGVNLDHLRNKRTHDIGTFYALSLGELEEQIRGILENIVSSEVIEDKFVILYSIRTYCSYWIYEGKPVPNGLYGKDHTIDENNGWREGTSRDSSDKFFGLKVYAQVYKKQVVRFRKGGDKTFYWQLDYQQLEKLGEFGKRLNHVSLVAYNIKDAYQYGGKANGMAEKFEIDYTEANAEFFYNLLMTICKINEQIKTIVQAPALLQELIEKQGQFLLSSQSQTLEAG